MSSTVKLNMCACGCGRETTVTYIHGHNRKGTVHTAQTISVMRSLAIASSRRPPISSGRDHHLWQETPSLNAVHKWVRRNKDRTGVCQKCTREVGLGRRGTEFANISGKYQRDVDDYIELCKTCHKEFDS